MTDEAIIPQYHLYGEGGPVEDFDFFHIETICARSRPLGWQLEPHKHVHLFQCLLLTGGAGRLIEDDGDRTVEPGIVAFTPPGVAHGWTFLPETEGFVLSFTQDYLAAERGEQNAAVEHALTLTGNTLIRVEGSDWNRIRAYMNELSEEFDSGTARRGIINPLLTLVIVRLFAADAARGDRPAGSGFSLFRFRVLLESNYKRERRPEFYANALGMSVVRLNRCCRVFSDRTVAQAVRDRLILEAKRLLAYSNLSISQIAFELGYEDPAYFSRVFRKETGHSPLEFRARQGGQI